MRQLIITFSAVLVALITPTLLAQVAVPNTAPSAGLDIIDDLPILLNGSERFKYVGCYRDYIESRQLAKLLYESRDLTIERCISRCWDKGWYFAGTANSIECWCGNFPPDVLDPDSYCQYRCSGNDTQICGGSGPLKKYHQISVYGDRTRFRSDWIHPAEMAIQDIKGWRYVGCFKPEGPLGISHHISPLNDVTTCGRKCGSQNYFGVMDRVHCYCSEIWTPTFIKMYDEQCNRLCPNDESQFCGGYARIQMYQAIVQPQTLVVGETVATTLATSPVQLSIVTAVSNTTEEMIGVVEALPNPPAPTSVVNPALGPPTQTLNSPVHFSPIQDSPVQATTPSSSHLSLPRAAPSAEPVADVSPTCPESDAAAFVSAEGLPYRITCFTEYVGYDIAFLKVENLAQCIAECDKRFGCRVAAWLANKSNTKAPCYLKTAQGSPVANDRIWGAVRIVAGKNKITMASDPLPTPTAANWLPTRTVPATTTLDDSETAGNPITLDTGTVEPTSDPITTTEVVDSDFDSDRSGPTSEQHTPEPTLSDDISTEEISDAKETLKTSAAPTTTNTAQLSTDSGTGQTSSSDGTKPTNVDDAGPVLNPKTPTQTAVPQLLPVVRNQDSTNDPVGVHIDPLVIDQITQSTPVVSTETVTVFQTQIVLLPAQNEKAPVVVQSLAAPVAQTPTIDPNHSAVVITVRPANMPTNTIPGIPPWKEAPPTIPQTPRPTVTQPPIVAGPVMGGTVNTLEPTIAWPTRPTPTPTPIEPLTPMLPLHPGVNGYEYQGCYKDPFQDKWNKFSRVFISNPKVAVSEQMTPLLCATRCRTWAYFGLRSNNKCYCASAMHDRPITALNQDTECNVPCGGDSNQLCGGVNRISVYRSLDGEKVVGVNKGPYIGMRIGIYRYIGCHVDTSNHRALVNSFVSDQNTIELCLMHAQRKYRRYAGAEAGRECYYGNHFHGNYTGIDGFNVRVPETQCMQPCYGDRGYFCGGLSRIGLWERDVESMVD